MIKTFLLIGLVSLFFPCISFGQERLEPVFERSDSKFHIDVVNHYVIACNNNVAYTCIVSSLDSPYYALLLFDDHCEVIWTADGFDGDDIICFELTVGAVFCNDMKKLYNAAILSAREPASAMESDNGITFELINPMGIAAKCHQSSSSNCRLLTDIVESVVVSIMNADTTSALSKTAAVRRLTEQFNDMDRTHEWSERMVYSPTSNDVGFVLSYGTIDSSVVRKNKFVTSDLYDNMDLRAHFNNDVDNAIGGEILISEVFDQY